MCSTLAASSLPGVLFSLGVLRLPNAQERQINYSEYNNIYLFFMRALIRSMRYFHPAHQVATVLQAEADDDERVVDLEKYHLDCSDVGEADIMALINNRRLAVVLNLTGCKR